MAVDEKVKIIGIAVLVIATGEGRAASEVERCVAENR